MFTALSARRVTLHRSARCATSIGMLSSAMLGVAIPTLGDATPVLGDAFPVLGDAFPVLELLVK